MKKLIFLSIFLLLAHLSTYAQNVITFKTQFINIRLYNEDTETLNEEWEGWKTSEVIIVFDNTENILNIYSEYEQRYVIISEIEKVFIADNDIIRMDAIDKEGIRATIEIVKRDNEIFHIYLRWSNFQMVYQMKKI